MTEEGKGLSALDRAAIQALLMAYLDYIFTYKQQLTFEDF
jgi:hypothetical protein